jgi:hypothetical protein
MINFVFRSTVCLWGPKETVVATAIRAYLNDLGGAISFTRFFTLYQLSRLCSIGWL